MVSFKCSREDHEAAREIAERAVRAARKARIDATFRDFWMDILATHCNGCQLRLQKLLVANDFDFSHDVFGIRRHLNRQTGQLEGCFVPRFAVPQEQAVR
jgi:hypothetical protein